VLVARVRRKLPAGFIQTRRGFGYVVPDDGGGGGDGGA
jgi:DNA-binding response OmpR family regulator